LRDFLRIAVMGNLHTEDRASRRNFDWLICWMSINQKSGRQALRRRIVSGSIFVSPVTPECFTERNENRAWSQVRIYEILKFKAGASWLPRGVWRFTCQVKIDPTGKHLLRWERLCFLIFFLHHCRLIDVLSHFSGKTPRASLKALNWSE